MHEDKLTHDERLRLECIAQANMTIQGGMRHPAGAGSFSGAVLDIAAKYEQFIRGSGATEESVR